MKHTYFTLFLIHLHFSLVAQLSLESQFGGSNFLGVTVNTSYDITLIESLDFGVRPKLGVGAILYTSEYGEVNIVNTGIEYYKGSNAIGMEASVFFAPPFIRDSSNFFIDLLVNPHFTKTHRILNSLYLRWSIGAYFAFSRTIDFTFERPELFWERPVIPSLGLTLGYKIGHLF